MSKHEKQGKASKATKKHAKTEKRTFEPVCPEVKAITRKLEAAGAEIERTPKGSVQVNVANTRVCRINKPSSSEKFYVLFALKPATKNFKPGNHKFWHYRYTGTKPVVAITKTFRALRHEK